VKLPITASIFFSNILWRKWKKWLFCWLFWPLL